MRKLNAATPQDHTTLSSTSWKTDLFFLTLGLVTFYLLFLGHYAVFSPDESRYSEIGREMLMSGNYITPRANGIIFLDKPILHYWLQAFAMRLLGVNEWVFRIVPTMFAILTVLVTYISGRLLFNRQTGLLASLILATSPLFFVGSHYANLDLEVAALISMSLLTFITGVTQKGCLRNILLLCSYLACSLAILTKGLIGIVFPIMVIGTWIIFTSQWKLLLRMHLVKGLGLILILTLPWYLLAERAIPGFFHYFFITQQFDRFTATAAHFNNRIPFWFYIPIILVGMLPWSCFLIQAIYTSIKQCFKRLKHYNELSFLLIMSALITLFFSIPQSKIITYIIPTFPAFALLIAYYFTYIMNANHKHLVKWCVIGITCNGLILLTLTFFADQLNHKSLKPLIITLKQHLQKEDVVINYYKHFSDVPLYLEQPIMVVNNWKDSKIPKTDNWAREFWIGKQFGDTSHIMINDTSFQTLWDSNKRVYVFVGDNFLAAFKEQIKNYYFVDDYQSRYYLFSNQPSDWAKQKSTFYKKQN